MYAHWLALSPPGSPPPSLSLPLAGATGHGEVEVEGGVEAAGGEGGMEVEMEVEGGGGPWSGDGGTQGQILAIVSRMLHRTALVHRLKVSVFVCLTVCVCVCVCVWESLCGLMRWSVCVSVCVYEIVCVSKVVCVCLDVSLCVCVSGSLCMCVCLRESMYASMYESTRNV